MTIARVDRFVNTLLLALVPGKFRWRQPFEDLISADWDLVIVDEAHRLGGSTDQVARYKLGQGLAEAAPYLLLLSATPHQGKTDAFHHLISLVDPVSGSTLPRTTVRRGTAS